MEATQKLCESERHDTLLKGGEKEIAVLPVTTFDVKGEYEKPRKQVVVSGFLSFRPPLIRSVYTVEKLLFSFYSWYVFKS